MKLYLGKSLSYDPHLNTRNESGWYWFRVSLDVRPVMRRLSKPQARLLRPHRMARYRVSFSEALRSQFEYRNLLRKDLLRDLRAPLTENIEAGHRPHRQEGEILDNPLRPEELR